MRNFGLSAILLFVILPLDAVADSATVASAVLSITKYQNVLAENECAPWDGAAVRFKFYKSKVSCDSTITQDFQVVVWRSLKVGTEYDLTSVDQTSNSMPLGTANSLPYQEEEKSNATSAKIKILKITETQIEGEINLKFGDNREESGKFVAEKCKNVVLCG